MNKKYKISLLVLGLILIFTILVAIIPSLLKVETKMTNPITQLGQKAYEINGSDKVGNAIITSKQHSSGFRYECRANDLNGLRIPNGLYCIQHGNHFEYDSRSVAQVFSMKGKTYTTDSTDATDKHASRPGNINKEEFSNTYYVCNNEHLALESYGAYIITQPSNIIAKTNGVYKWDKFISFSAGQNISEEVRQMAIWISNLNIGPKPHTTGEFFTYMNIAENLEKESKDYEDYEKTLSENIENPIKETSNKKVQINVNNKDQYIIVGPYKLDYVNGIADSVAFAGISNIKVNGYNDKDKTKFIKDVKLLSYFQNAEESSIVYFKPTEGEGYVDRLKKLGEDNLIKTLSYPQSGQEFYLKIKNPNQGVVESDKKVNYIEIEVEYQYMTANGTKCKLDSKVAHAWVKSPTLTSHHDEPWEDSEGKSHYDCTKNWIYKWDAKDDEPIDHQAMIDAWGERNLYKKVVKLKGNGDEDTLLLDITMNLGGYVWEDVPEGKESVSNGLKDTGNNSGDRVIPNVKVTLYECPLDEKGNLQYSNGQLVRHVADLLSNVNRNELSDEELNRRINPQLTDSNGYYQFNGLDSSNKYYVAFEYNGQEYLPTDYLVDGKDENGKLTHYNSVQEMVNAKLYNTDIWRITSKGTEAERDRTNYNKKFEEIESSPLNYKSSNSLRSGMLASGYNETFSQYELMGFILDENGNYERNGINLIDGFYTEKDGNIIATNTLQEGIISRKIKEYMNRNKKYPEDIKVIYQEIANSYPASQRQEIWRKLQFIEDCKMKAYTGSPFKNGGVDFYPVYDDFTIGNTSMTIPGKGTVPPIYDGQYYVNLGLWRRQETDIALRKDILYAATRINGKTEVYEYDKRAQTTLEQRRRLKQAQERYENNGRTQEDYENYLRIKNEVEEATYWEIQLRMKDYNNYYASTYTRETYPADYSYRKTSSHTGDELELYVTYRITVRNTSQSVLTQVNEIVDYYDTDYTYIDDLSWIMYSDDNNNDDITIKKSDYHETINNYSNKRNFKGDLRNTAKDVDSDYATKTNRNGTYTGSSKYGQNSKSDMEEEYNSLYVRGLEGKKLQSGEEAYVYLTFRVNEDRNGRILLDSDNDMKQNYAEINGYSTYYKDGTDLPNGVTVGSRDAAGFIDINSNPGNLCLNDLQGDRPEKNFENDTDRAKSIKVTVNSEFVRSINGNVWEDQRTQIVNNAIIGNGVMDKNEIKVQGVTVELIEKLSNGKEYVWETTKTDKNGKYEFRQNIIPGDYIIRFKYGNNDATVLTTKNGGKNTVSYNGQDFKSTVYQKDMKNNREVSGYNDKYYNIREADRFNGNLSDAKDIWDRRNEVNSYSSSKVTNHIAEVLASPYASSVNRNLINELINNTNMTAETGIIVLEGEYNRTSTNGDRNTSNGKDDYRYGNDLNGNYTLNNVDFGLTERPKAQLELSKKVTNVKVTLANGSTLFDATKGTTDLVWVKGSAYKLNDKMSNKKYEEYYNKDHRYAYRSKVNDLVSGKYDSTGNNGLINVIMDEELMHGATIRISYDLTVSNVGETDYTGKDFYYKGTGTNNKVTTTANQVIDYVANNLQFRSNDNKNNGWGTISNSISSAGLNSNLTNNVAKYNTIIQTQKFGENSLKPGDSETVGLVLTQLITPENNSDDKTYNNIAEITSISNTVGRRMAYSIQGNQNPDELPQEVDSSKAEEIAILPPFGIGNIVTYIAVALGTLVILTVGIVFIKKKVLNK